MQDQKDTQKIVIASSALAALLLVGYFKMNASKTDHKNDDSRYMKGSSLDKNQFGKSGAFKRTESLFRDAISSKPGSKYPVEKGRYHLYINLACPWANGALTMLDLKGLQEYVSLSSTAPVWGVVNEAGRKGWVFDKKWNAPQAEAFDHNYGLESMYQIYRKSSPGYEDKVTVPCLWDKKTQKIVNNESSEIIKMFNSEFNDVSSDPELDIYPLVLRKEIDEASDWIYNDINNGVYKCGFAQTQEAYEQAFHALFGALDRVEKMLEGGKMYLIGNQFTYCDLRLFQTLIRFDAVYVVHFKTNKRTIESYPNISRFVRHMYHDVMGTGLKKFVNIEHIKLHYYGTHDVLNPKLIVPVGPDHWWEKPNSK